MFAGYQGFIPTLPATNPNNVLRAGCYVLRATCYVLVATCDVRRATRDQRPR